MRRVYLSVGSNIEPERNIPVSLRLLGKEIHLLAVSTFYRTNSIGPAPAPPFYNGVLVVETHLGLRDLKFGVLRRIEETLGRVRTADRYMPRPIDLDVLLMENMVVREADLELPDPNILQRRFLAVALCELDPDLILPNSGRKLKDMLSLVPQAPMVPLEEFTRELQQQIKPEKNHESPTHSTVNSRIARRDR